MFIGRSGRPYACGQAITAPALDVLPVEGWYNIWDEMELGDMGWTGMILGDTGWDGAVWDGMG